MIVNEKLWDFFLHKYGLEDPNQEILRFGIIVNEDTEETIVEVYLRQLLIFPVPNNVLKFDVPRTLLLSRKETILDLEKKAQRAMNARFYELQERGTLITKCRLWKSLTNQLNEIKDLDKKYKNYTSVKIDGICLNVHEQDRNKLIEDLDLAEEDIIIVEMPKGNQFILVP